MHLVAVAVKAGRRQYINILTGLGYITGQIVAKERRLRRGNLRLQIVKAISPTRAL